MHTRPTLAAFLQPQSSKGPDRQSSKQPRNPNLPAPPPRVEHDDFADHFEDDGGENVHELNDGGAIIANLPRSAQPSVLFNSSRVMIAGEEQRLVSTKRLDPNHRQIFPFRYFNPVQSECFDDAYLNDGSLIVSAPTGGGKTTVAELAVLRLFGPTHCHSDTTPKAVYIAPLKALCDERVRHWGALFAPIGIRVIAATSDRDVGTYELEACDIIVATPEKWDSVSRKRDVMSTLQQRVGLIVLDEIHLLNESRGAALEGIVARSRLIQDKAIREWRNQDIHTRANALPAFADSTAPPITKLRFIGLSATIPNRADVATWIDGEALHFDERYRPVRLHYEVRSYSSASNPYMFDNSLNSQVLPIIAEHAKDEQGQRQPTLVFCPTRKSVSMSATTIAKDAHNRGQIRLLVPNDDIKRKLRVLSNKLEDVGLRQLVLDGVAFHHAGLSYTDREMLEKAFQANELMVVCATSTLALGVNLPAHLVIIKSTRFWSGPAGWVDYDSSTVLQMTGRAGRPQFSLTGVAVVMCEHEQKQRYLQLVQGQLNVESCFKPVIISHLNSEIVAGSVKDENDALVWIRNTFLYARVKSNPHHYGASFRPTDQLTDEQRDAIVTKWLRTELERLISAHCITWDEKFQRFNVLEKGKLMNQYYLRFETLQIFDELAPVISFSDCLYLYCKAAEFENLRIRQGDKAILNACIKSTTKKRKTGETENLPVLPFALPEGRKTVATLADKLFILAQAAMVGRKIEDSNNAFNLRQDIDSLMGVGSRVAQAMAQYAIQQKIGRLTIKHTLMLIKCIDRRCLPNFNSGVNTGRIFTQMKGVGAVGAAQIVDAGFTSIRALLSANPAQLDATNVKNLYQLMNVFPRYEIQVQENLSPKSEYAPNASSNDVELEITVQQIGTEFEPTDKGRRHCFDVIVTEQPGKTLFCYQFHLTKGVSTHKIPPIPAKPGASITIDVIDSKYVGVDMTFVHEVKGQLDHPENDMLDGIADFAPTPHFTVSTADDIVDRFMMEDEEAAKDAESAEKPTICKHFFENCLRSECKHACCAARLATLGREKGEFLDKEEILRAKNDIETNKDNSSSSKKSTSPEIPAKRTKPAFVPPKRISPSSDSSFPMVDLTSNECPLPQMEWDTQPAEIIEMWEQQEPEQKPVKKRDRVTFANQPDFEQFMYQGDDEPHNEAPKRRLAPTRNPFEHNESHVAETPAVSRMKEERHIAPRDYLADVHVAPRDYHPEVHIAPRDYPEEIDAPAGDIEAGSAFRRAFGNKRAKPVVPTTPTLYPMITGMRQPLSAKPAVGKQLLNPSGQNSHADDDDVLPSVTLNTSRHESFSRARQSNNPFNSTMSPVRIRSPSPPRFRFTSPPRTLERQADRPAVPLSTLLRTTAATRSTPTVVRSRSPNHDPRWQELAILEAEERRNRNNSQLNQFDERFDERRYAPALRRPSADERIAYVHDEYADDMPLYQPRSSKRPRYADIRPQYDPMDYEDTEFEVRPRHDFNDIIHQARHELMAAFHDGGEQRRDQRQLRWPDTSRAPRDPRRQPRS